MLSFGVFNFKSAKVELRMVWLKNHLNKSKNKKRAFIRYEGKFSDIHSSLFIERLHHL